MVKICASLNSVSEIPDAGNANIVEIKVGNTYQELPKGIDKPMIIRVKSNEMMNRYAKEEFDGYLDIGTNIRPRTDHKIIASYHNDVRTGSSKDIADLMNSFDCDIAKGVYKINRPTDLLSLYDASKNIRKKHILLGMGEMGVVTRLRPNILHNEFTYARLGAVTAEGQMTVDELCKADDDSLIVGLLGHPLDKSRTKSVFTSVFNELGMNAFYLNFDTMTMENFDEVIRTYEIKGLNVTMPFKNEMYDLVDSWDHSAVETGSINTILNSGSKLIGSNTDVYGFMFAISRAGIDVNGKKILIIGSGGIAKAGACACMSKGAEVSMIGRDRKMMNAISKKIGCEITADTDPSGYDIVINCSPIGLYTDYGYPIDINGLTSEQSVLDISYSGESQIRNAAESKGCTIIPGLDVLIGGAMKSFEIWTGKQPDYEMFVRPLI